MKAEIISIGNELLLGDVLDTNSHLLTRELTSFGVEVIRRHTIRDTIEEIVRFLDYTLNHDKADIVVTTGGLGPTDDDMTFEGVAKFLEVELIEDPRSLLYLTERVELLNVLDDSRERTLVPERRKMALLPKGGTPLFNPTGAAPGLWYEIGDQVLMSLPGVPVELKGIWDVEVKPRLEKLTEKLDYHVCHFIVKSSDESSLAPLVRIVASKYPDFHFKTRPRRIGNTWEMKLDVSHFCSPGADEELNSALDDLVSLMEKEGIEIEKLE